MDSNDRNNIVPFPRLADRLLEKGIMSLKEKSYRQALDLFEQLSEIEPGHPQALYGLSVCYVELGFYEKAKNLTKEMMQKGVGDYFDVLKLHITVLIQMKKYTEVISIVDAVLAEKNVPTDIRQTLVQLAYFATQRVEEPDFETGDIPDLESNNEDNNFKTAVVPAHIEKEIEHGLNSGNHEQQWSAIRLAKEYNAGFQSLLKYLESPGDPILKSLVLQGLKENGHTKSVKVSKFNNTHIVDLNEPLFYNGFSDSVTAILDDKLSSNNPTLQDVATQIWSHFVLLIFPHPLEPKDPNMWASACYAYSLQISGMEDEQQTLESLFNTSIESIEPLVDFMRSIEEST